MNRNTANNIRSTDRIFVLKPRADVKSSSGLLDKGLFDGKNRLHAKMDPQNCLWSLNYDRGIVPPVFKQQFTSFGKAEEFIRGYMERRNIDITEVID